MRCQDDDIVITREPHERWRQVADQIRAEIHAQRWLPGGRLDSEQAFARRFGVSRQTVRRALLSLGQRGEIRAEERRGSVVMERPLTYRIDATVSFSANLRLQSVAPSSRLLQSEIVGADAMIAEAFGVALGAPILRICSMGMANNVPVVLSRREYEAARFPDLAARYEELGSIGAALRSYGLGKLRRVSNLVSARLPTDAEARLLCIPVHMPLLVNATHSVDETNRTLELGEGAHVADRIQFHFGSD